MPGAWMPPPVARSTGLAGDCGDLVGGNATRSQKAHNTVLDLHDRRFQADGGGAGIDDQRDAVAEIGLDMRRRGRTEPPRGIGAGGGERTAESLDQFGGEAARHAHGERVEPRGHQRMHGIFARQRQHQRQRPRPEFLRQLSRNRVDAHQPLRHVEAGDMGDQRVEARPALGLEDARHRFAVGGVGGEPVDGLRRQRHHAAVAKHGKRSGERAVGGKDFGQG